MVIVVVAVAMVCTPVANSFSAGEKEGKILATATLENVKVDVTDNGNSVTGCLGDVQISSDPADDEHPTIVKAPDGSYLVAYDRQVSPLEGHVYFMRSTDGNTWSEIFNTNAGDMASGLQTWPALVVPPGSSNIYGVWDDEAMNYQYVMHAADASDPSSWDIGFLDQSGEDSDRSGYDIAAINDITWGWCFVGHVEFAGYDLPSAIEAEFGLGAWDEIAFSWTGDQFFPESHNPDIAATTNNIWLVWDYPTESQTEGIGIHWGDPNAEGDIAVWPVTTMESSHNYADPTIGGSGSNLCMVYMTDDNIYGDWDLACRYSTDEGSTWQDGTFPSMPQVDEKSPEIFMSGSTVFCAFIRNGNLYLAKSTDLGQTWGDPEQVNTQDGTVVDEPGSVKLSQAGIVWVDNRNGNKDIYYAPLPSAIINVDSISGGMGVTATVTNTGTEDGTNVDWSIALSGPVFLGKETTGTIDTLAAGSETTISTGLVFGIGPTTITVTAGGASKTASGFVLGPMVLGVT